MSPREESELLRFVGLDKARQKAKVAALREAIVDGEDFRFARIKMDGKKPRYELPNPTREDAENTEIEPSFEAVAVLVKKNFYQSDEDKEAGIEAKEKRSMYLLRLGRYQPEIFYASPTGVTMWQRACAEIGKGSWQKNFAAEIKKIRAEYDDKIPYHVVLLRVSAELVKGKYTYSKPVFSVVRPLTADELAHVEDVREMIEERIGQWADAAELEKAEEEAMAVDRRGKNDRVEEVNEERQHSKRRRSIEEDEEEAPAKSKTSRSRKAATDDEDEAPAKSTRRKPADDEEDERPARKAASRKQEDDDEDEAPAKSTRRKPADDDEDEAPAKSTGTGGYPSLDDDDDDDLAEAAPRKRSRRDDDDDD